MSISHKWFDELYLENAPRMVKMAAYLLNDQHLAEDLVNEAFLILLYKKDQLENHPNLPGWLSQTLKNLIADEMKSAKRRLEHPLNEDVEKTSKDLYEPPLSALLPAGLSPIEREILILFYEKQLTYDQISAKLGISVLNCRTRLFRAKAHYKELIEKKR